MIFNHESNTKGKNFRVPKVKNLHVKLIQDNNIMNAAVV
jgi:hypothetical protein